MRRRPLMACDQREGGSSEQQATCLICLEDHFVTAARGASLVACPMCHTVLHRYTRRLPAACARAGSSIRFSVGPCPPAEAARRALRQCASDRLAPYRRRCFHDYLKRVDSPQDALCPHCRAPVAGFDVSVKTNRKGQVVSEFAYAEVAWAVAADKVIENAEDRYDEDYVADSSSQEEDSDDADAGPSRKRARGATTGGVRRAGRRKARRRHRCPFPWAALASRPFPRGPPASHPLGEGVRLAPDPPGDAPPTGAS